MAGMVFLALGAVGCGEPEPGDPTPVQTFKITPADPGVAATPSAGPEASPTQSAGGGGTTLELAGIGSVFDPEELEAPPGDITIVFDNQDAGVVHNLHVFEGEDADGEDIAETELETGPLVQELPMTLDAGQYFYVCDAHPTTMKGVLEVG
jgi:plastocyanin